MGLTVSERVSTILTRFFAARLAAAPRVGVALSGGMDSVVLLHALLRLRASGAIPLELSAVHVHHGLSSRADAWADFCAECCREWGVPLELVRVSVPRDSGEGLEGAARRLRHAAFSACAADWLALAHHRDDQAETVLLNLLRGAGVAGAAGMLAERPQRHGPTLIRPLLDVPRSMIEAYAAEHGLRWIDDESNADRHFRRNFLRHDILPALEDKFSGARQSLARAAGHFAETSQLLDELATLDLERVCQASGRIGLAAFNSLSPARARNLLRHAWSLAGFRAPDARWIDEALKQLAAADTLSETCVATPEGKLHVYRGELYMVPQRPATPPVPVSCDGVLPLSWAGGVLRFEPTPGEGIRRDWFNSANVELRPRQGGERFKRQLNRPRRNLRNVLQEAAIPPWERERLPLLWIGGRLAWVGGLGVDADFVCQPDEAGVLPVWEA